ncbi:MAG: metallophosphoesterase [Ignavibacteria bacterium]|jgi:3',5'-cyclic AMP phosphodiesterase CpdA|nr:metallophosphoesterase [Ignavibacteria bacterium]MCU7524090.1 metallophosphoesterase [Ignavibacteria bacterium]
MKIAHISDLHVCTRRNFRNIKNARRLLEHIINNNYDHVVITGDITENGNEKEFRLIRKLLEEFNLLDTNKLSVVIGNHDIYGGIQFAEDIIGFPEKCSRTNYKMKLREFEVYFREAFERIYAPGDDFFPYAKDLGEVVLLGINSISEYSKMKNLFASKGKISESQYDGLREIFSSGKYMDKTAVALVHHHFYKVPFFSFSNESSIWARIENEAMKLRGRKKFLKFLQSGNVKLALHGHVHESVEYSKKGIRCLNAGETFRPGFPERISYNSITVDGASIMTENVVLPDKKELKLRESYPQMQVVCF